LSTAPTAFRAASWPDTRSPLDRINASNAHRVALALAAVAIGTLPWLHPAGPGNSSPTDIAIVAAIAGVAVWVYLSRELIRAPFGLSVGLLVIAGCIAGIVGPLLRGALVDVGYPQAPLIAIVQDLYLLCWCLALVNLARSASALRVILAAWVTASAFWAALMIVGVVLGITVLSGINDIDGVRADGQFGDPNMAANYFALSFLVLWSSSVPRRPWLRAFVALLILTAMIFTGSNGGFLSLGIGLAFIALAAVRRHYGPIATVLAACLALMVAVGATQLINVSDVQHWARDSGIPIFRDWIGRSATSASQRVLILQETWNVFLRSGLFGAGPNATQPVLVDTLAPFPHQAHDDYVAAVVERGVLGGVALIVLICAIILRAGQALGGRLRPDFAAVVPRREALVGALLGLAAAAAYYQVLHFRHVWALLAVIAALQLWGRDWAKA
jgi:O-antigen ligase